MSAVVVLILQAVQCNVYGEILISYIQVLVPKGTVGL
jgi:hypothetical protein